MASSIRRRPQVLVYNVSLPFLKCGECEQVKGQLSDIANDVKENRWQIRNRGFHI